MINGNFIGYTDKPDEFTHKYKEFRDNGSISIYSSIYWDITNSIIEIYTDAGRCIRPLLVVNDGKLEIDKYKDILPTLEWDDLTVNILRLPTKCIEFIDAYVQ